MNGFLAFLALYFTIKVACVERGSGQGRRKKGRGVRDGSCSSRSLSFSPLSRFSPFPVPATQAIIDVNVLTVGYYCNLQ